MTRKKKKVPRDKCVDCDATGKMFPNCEVCEGFGWVYDPSDGGTMTCPDCQGEQCQECEE